MLWLRINSLLVFFSARCEGFWPLNAALKGTDLSGNGNTASLSDVEMVAPTFGKHKVYRLKGTTNSYITIPLNTPLNLTNSQTYLMFIFVPKAMGPIMEYVDNNNILGMVIWAKYAPDQTLGWHINTGGGSWHTVSSAFPILNMWYFMGFSFDQASKKLMAWRHGQVMDTVDLPTTPNTRGNRIILGMRVQTSYRWVGRVACLMIYAGLMTQAEVGEAWNNCVRTFYGKSHTYFLRYL